MSSERIVPVLLAGVLLLVTGTTARAQQPLVSPEFARRLELLSSHPSILAAKSLGITSIAGKPLNDGRSPGDAQSWKLIDVAIGDHPTKHENEPTVAVNPKTRKRLVAGSHYFGPPAPTENRCVAYTSNDGGATWSAPIPMPQLTLASVCSDPVLVYAPDGDSVYYAYMDIKNVGFQNY